jgi:hypothetical protein
MHESKPVRSLLSAATTNRWRRKRSWAGSSWAPIVMAKDDNLRTWTRAAHWPFRIIIG